MKTTFKLENITVEPFEAYFILNSGGYFFAATPRRRKRSATRQDAMEFVTFAARNPRERPFNATVGTDVDECCSHHKVQATREGCNRHNRC